MPGHEAVLTLYWPKNDEMSWKTLKVVFFINHVAKPLESFKECRIFFCQARKHFFGKMIFPHFQFDSMSRQPHIQRLFSSKSTRFDKRRVLAISLWRTQMDNVYLSYLTVKQIWKKKQCERVPPTNAKFTTVVPTYSILGSKNCLTFCVQLPRIISKDIKKPLKHLIFGKGLLDFASQNLKLNNKYC